ncbi:uncharacterized protein BCR38DRAFT_426504 [Pseudomassariella vexata]|uniref:DUF7703 domain-containing protein n=1 Tax=Pseudomassariella vexata TaxID=1141098 RepID=A0A1Y2E6R7_9PEZI|nr:uncharacterized protein BCR38DRAFT_426504 [Pseudomassariella vexata]ORY67258.1 hypothetical protein BCR38DRAFT_426504 [Pseudomassariella vexata]
MEELQLGSRQPYGTAQLPRRRHRHHHRHGPGLPRPADHRRLSPGRRVVKWCRDGANVAPSRHQAHRALLLEHLRRHFWGTIGFVVNDFELTQSHFVPALLTVCGWTPMVTGQSLVLYSRLHLLYIDSRILRFVLGIIVFNAITMHIPILVVASNSHNPGPFLVPYRIYKRIEVTVFFIQETVISSIYLWKSFGFLSSHHFGSGDKEPVSSASESEVKAIILHLIAVNFFVIALDITIIVLEYFDLYLIQTSYKSFVYSVKLKCEFGILNRLVHFVKRKRRAADESSRITEQLERELETTLARNFGAVVREVRTDGEAQSVLIRGVRGDNSDADMVITRPTGVRKCAEAYGE